MNIQNNYQCIDCKSKCLSSCNCINIKKITSCSCTGCEKLCTENCACKSLKMEILIKYFKFVLNNNYNKNMYLNKEGGINGK